jgi:hypothetical protein
MKLDHPVCYDLESLREWDSARDIGGTRATVNTQHIAQADRLPDKQLKLTQGYS